jgi:Asp-tRNA(Asn)/Glu-tRNA(Gln) amidotransferase A subunit family amidase
VVEAARDGSLALHRAATLQASLSAFAELTPAYARARADDLTGPLAGMPVGVKDVIDLAGVPTRLGTPRAGHHVPERSAPVVEALLAAGAAVVGKTTTHELAFGLVTPQTRNPFCPDRIAGGSSGGSAAAVGAGIVAAALGTDTSGSVRCPAALCGTVGLKPTLGTLSTDGVAPLAPSQDTVGVLASSARTCAAVFGVLTGSPLAPLRNVTGMRVGIDRQTCQRSVAPDVGSAVLDAAGGLREVDVELVDVEIPEFGLAASASAVILFSEAAASWGEWLDRDPGGFGADARAALLAGRGVAPSARERAQQVRDWIRTRMRALYLEAGLDAVLSPTVAVTAPQAGTRTVTLAGRDHALEAALARFTSLASVTGQPALSVPCGLSSGLPIGLQLIGRPAREHDLLSLAAAVERLVGGVAVERARSGLLTRDGLA